MLTSSGRCLRASVVVISWTSYGSGIAFSLMFLVYVMYVAFTICSTSGPGLTHICARASHDGRSARLLRKSWTAIAARRARFAADKLSDGW